MYAQLITGYGIMTALIIIAIICSYWRKGLDYVTFLAIVANAYAPTSISFLATGLFDFDFIKKRKVINSAYITLTVCSALFYAAFSSMDSIEAELAVVFAIISIVFSFVAVFALFGHTTVSLSNATTGRKTSDGTIVGRRNG